ncbi:hypothetical protein [Acidobacterium sp. S8]|uniref:hypothetical protein n=1 Tax=Acidobacterium sp. S8 TaxID=1641854 RepID=UPI0020B15705|nr:hypothetical protein [Acidobacterium sp. S8]
MLQSLFDDALKGRNSRLALFVAAAFLGLVLLLLTLELGLPLLPLALLVCLVLRLLASWSAARCATSSTDSSRARVP